MMKMCFLNKERSCTAACAAFQETPGRFTDCKLLSFLDRLIPPPSRPTAPVPPPKVKT